MSNPYQDLMDPNTPVSAGNPYADLVGGSRPATSGWGAFRASVSSAPTATADLLRKLGARLTLAMPEAEDDRLGHVTPYAKEQARRVLDEIHAKEQKLAEATEGHPIASTLGAMAGGVADPAMWLVPAAPVTRATGAVVKKVAPAAAQKVAAAVAARPALAKAARAPIEGAGLSTAFSAAENVAEGRPVTEGLGRAAVVGAGVGAGIQGAVSAAPYVAKAGGKVARGAGNLAAEVIGTETGRGTKFVTEALRGGRVSAETGEPSAFKRGIRGEFGPLDVVEDARQSYYKMSRKIGRENKAEYAWLKQHDNKRLGMEPIRAKLGALLREYDIKGSPSEETFMQSMGLGREGASKVKAIIDRVVNWTDDTPSGLNRLKKELDSFYTETGRARGFVKSMAGAVRAHVAENVPGYISMLQRVGERIKTRQDVGKELMLRKSGMTGEITPDQVIRRLISTMKEDVFPARSKMLKTMDEAAGTDIAGQVAGLSGRQFLPAGMQAKGMAGLSLVGMVKFADPKLWPVLALASPRVAGEFLQFLGRATGAFKKGSGGKVRPPFITPAEVEAVQAEARRLAETPPVDLDTPTFRRRGGLIPEEPPEAVLQRLPPAPRPRTAEESAEVFSAMPPQAPAAERATAFVGPNEMLRRTPAGQSAAVFEEAFARKSPQERAALLDYLTEQESAQGHVPVLSPPEGPLALPPGQGFEMEGAPRAVFPPDEMARGHVPVLGPHPQPKALPAGFGNWRVPERWRLPPGTQDFSLVGQPFEPPNPRWSGAQWELWFRRTPGAMEFFPKPEEGKRLTRADFADAAERWQQANMEVQQPPEYAGQAQTRTPFQQTDVQDVTPIPGRSLVPFDESMPPQWAPRGQGYMAAPEIEGRRLAPSDPINAITEQEAVRLVQQGRGDEAARHVREGMEAGKVTLQEAEDSIVNDAMKFPDAGTRKRKPDVGEAEAKRVAEGLEEFRGGLREGAQTSTRSTLPTDDELRARAARNLPILDAFQKWLGQRKLIQIPNIPAQRSNVAVPRGYRPLVKGSPEHRQLFEEFQAEQTPDTSAGAGPAPARAPLGGFPSGAKEDMATEPRPARTDQIGSAAPPAPTEPTPAAVDADFMRDAAPMARSRMLRALGRNLSFNGELKTRAQGVEDLVAAGASIITAREGRRLQRPNGNFVAEKDLGETAMRYAEHLIGKRSLAPPAPKPTPQEWFQQEKAKAANRKGKKTAPEAAPVTVEPKPAPETKAQETARLEATSAAPVKHLLTYQGMAWEQTAKRLIQGMMQEVPEFKKSPVFEVVTKRAKNGEEGTYLRFTDKYRFDLKADAVVDHPELLRPGERVRVDLKSYGQGRAEDPYGAVSFGKTRTSRGKREIAVFGHGKSLALKEGGAARFAIEEHGGYHPDGRTKPPIIHAAGLPLDQAKALAAKILTLRGRE